MTAAPAAVIRGDTIEWTVSAAGWGGLDPSPSLAVAVYGAEKTVTAAVVRDGGGWRVTIDATTSQTLPAGAYSWIARATGSGYTQTLATGAFEVLPVPQAGAVSGESHAARMVRALEAQLEKLAADPLEQYSVGERDAKRRSMAEVKRLLTAYRREVAMEANGGRLPSITFGFGVGLA